MERKKVICLISGGLDSATLMAYAVEMGCELYGLFANYRQRTLEKERSCSKALCNYYGVKEFREIDLGALASFGGSGLFQGASEELLTEKNLVSQYVPFRNSVLISMATAWAEVIKADFIYVGATKGPWVSPDNSPEYFAAYNQLISRGTMLKGALTVEAPMNHMSKKEVVELGLRLKVPYELSWSCHNFPKKACGICSNCMDRLAGFAAAGATDPIPYLGKEEICL